MFNLVDLHAYYIQNYWNLNSSNNFWIKMQYSFFVEDLPVAASTDQLMEEYES